MDAAEATKSRKKMKPSSSKKKALQRNSAKTRVEEIVRTEAAESLDEGKTLASDDGLVAGARDCRDAYSSKNEIDDIFGQKKRRRSETNSAGESERPLHVNKERKKVTGRVRSGSRIGGNREERRVKNTVTSRQKTSDGLAIYAEDELKLNSKNAGGTPLCPFDCDCCF